MAAHWFAGTKTEFRLRVLSISMTFCGAYLTNIFDHVLAGVVAAGWLQHWLGPRFANLSEDAWVRAVLLAGAALTLLAAMIRTWATSYLKAAVMRDFKLHSERLVADGPYRRVRNPLYFGNMLMAVGMGLTAPRTGFFLLVIGMFVIVLRLILREEAGLRETQGESYRAYCAAVPRLIPSITPRVPSAGGTPNWKDGFFGELMIWGFCAAVFVLALTFNGNAFLIIMGASFGVQWIVFAIQKRSEKSAANR